METKKTSIAKTIMRKRNRAGGITFPDVRLFYNTNLPSSKHYGTGTKTDTQVNGTGQGAQK